MDAHKPQGGEKGGAAAAGEVRRIHVVYFLSRGGRTDHPHLFRVNHLHRAGVRLRDVKRWLSELRGKDMPDNYSWSYKSNFLICADPVQLCYNFTAGHRGRPGRCSSPERPSSASAVFRLTES